MCETRASSRSASFSCSVTLSGTSGLFFARNIRLPTASSGLLISWDTVAARRAAVASFSVRRYLQLAVNGLHDVVRRCGLPDRQCHPTPALFLRDFLPAYS